jgi:hypothetical protein
LNSLPLNSKVILNVEVMASLSERTLEQPANK